MKKFYYQHSDFLQSFAMFTIIVACFVLGGCAVNKEYYAAMQAKYEADGKARVAQALSDGKKWDALTKAADSDVGRTALGIVAAVSETKGHQAAASTTADNLKPPRDWVDTGLAFLQVFTGVARVVTDYKSVVVGGEVRKAEILGRVEEKRIDGATQLGIVDTVAKNGGIHVTAGGDVVAGSGTIDKKDCKSAGGTGGNGAPSGSGGAGAAGGSGSNGTTANAAPGAASGPGGSGGAGGTAGGNCGP